MSSFPATYSDWERDEVDLTNSAQVVQHGGMYMKSAQSET